MNETTENSFLPPYDQPPAPETLVMEYWVGPGGEVYSYPDNGSQDAYRDKVDGIRKMTPAEVEAHLNPVPPLWTDGSSLREAFAMDLPGWRLATDPEVEDLTYASLMQAVEMRTGDYRKRADTAIAPLQDAVDLGEATEKEESRLKEWKRYRIALSRIPEQTGYPESVEWPVAPV